MKISSTVLAAFFGLASQAALAAATGEAAAYPQGEPVVAAARDQTRTTAGFASSEPQYTVRGDVVIANPAYRQEPASSAHGAAAAGASGTIYVN